MRKEKRGKGVRGRGDIGVWLWYVGGGGIVMLFFRYLVQREIGYFGLGVSGVKGLLRWHWQGLCKLYVL